MNEPDAGDAPQVLLFKTATYLQQFSGVTAFFNDSPQVLLYKIALGAQAAAAGGGGGGGVTTLASTTADGLLKQLGNPLSTLQTIGGAQRWVNAFSVPTNLTGNSTNGTGASSIPIGTDTPSAGLPGYVGRIGTGTTATGAAAHWLGNSGSGCGFPIASTTEVLASAWLQLSALSDGTDTFLAYYGLLGARGAVTVAITNMVGFRIEGSTLKAVCMSAGTETTLTWTGTVTATVAIFVQLRWVVGSGVTFWVNGLPINGGTGTISTNLPTNTSQLLEMDIIKSAGLTSRSIRYSQPICMLVQ